jgi:hypothetical protein
MVQTGRPGASSSTPTKSPGLRVLIGLRLDPNIGVHLMRTITLIYRHYFTHPIGSAGAIESCSLCNQ